MKSASLSRFLLFAICLLTALAVQAEVMLQWFETEWDEMYRKMPVAAQVGYDYIWAPPPTKAPTGLGTKWGNVGYSMYDHFDIGDVPQRGSYATRYGTRGSLRNMVDAAHRLDVNIIPDIVMNHRGNGPDFRSYLGMTPTDFHVEWSPNYCNELNFKRAPTMTQWYHNYGYGGTMWQDLANLIDIRTEDHPLSLDPKRFTGSKTIEGITFNFVDGTSYFRHIGKYDMYPYAYTNENAAEMLYRWIVWLGNAMDYDGLRLDAGKHVPKEFFGSKAQGFLHEAQYNFSSRRGFNFGNDPQDLWNNYVLKTNALIFAEILSPWSEIAQYWASSAAPYGYDNPMRYLDYQIKQAANSALNGSIGSFFMNDFGPNQGITYIWGHDEGPASKANLGYAYILTHIGMPMVYYTGNNITWADYGRSADKKTWMVPGHDSEALGEVYNNIPNLVWVHQQFARGAEMDLWHDNDFMAYQRYDSTATSGKGLLVVALNDSGSDISHELSGLYFDDGTVLHDYTGHNASDVTVNGGKATFTVPANGGQGWVCYAPRIPENLNTRILQSGTDAPTITWVVPGGVNQAPKTQQVTRVTSSNFTVSFSFAHPSGGAVDAAMMKWGRGDRRFTTNYFDEGRGNVSGRHEKMTPVGTAGTATNWQLNIVATNLPEGLQVIKCRAFVQRSAGYPALFNTYTKVVYIDLRGPESTVVWPTEGATVRGDTVMIITNNDYLAYGMTVALDGGAAETAHEVYKGIWKYNLTGLNAGTHTALVTTTEADWANTRQPINTSTTVRIFTVVSNANPISISVAGLGEGGTQYTTFFQTSVQAGGSPSDVKLIWNGYELAWNAGNYTNVFNGEVVYRDNQGRVTTNRLWGNFVNGQNFFEAYRVDAGVTSRVTRRVNFNLYGINAIDSDSDSLPDNVEMPFIDSNGAPGADQPWPGDSNKNFIPESWETWSRLNPYNASTYYSGQWDDNRDSDGDGFSNGREVLAGYYDSNNIYAYNIYDAASKPSTNSGTPVTPSAASWTPSNAVRGAALVITYYPNGGTLSNKAQVVAHIGISKRTLGVWTNVIDTNMTAIGGGNWQVSYPVPTNATSVDFTFHDGAGTWDGKDWQATVAGTTNPSGFNMDGYLDSTNYIVFAPDMRIAAAVRGNDLYVATWSAEGSDHFIYVTDEIGSAKPTPWAKAGYVFMDTSSKPYLTAESYGTYVAWNNISSTNKANGNRSPANKDALEGAFNLVDAFGRIPEAVYIAAVAYANPDGGGILSQGPYAWDSGDNIDSPELLCVPLASIHDEDGDGYFDGGKPNMWTVVNGDTNDANYNIRRFFLNELAGETASMTVIVEPCVGTNVLSNVELFSNLNRRDFAVLPGDEDPNSVTLDSKTTYYRAYPMTHIGGGKYAATITINKCGAYRVNARWKINGGSYQYYTDHGLRRDCAVIVSPKKALNMVMYELNPMFAEATSPDFYGRSTFKDMYLANTNKPNFVSTGTLTNLGINMIWLQPIHPIGSENRQTDPVTMAPYDPGSPYAVRDYWSINSVLGDPSSPSNAMKEFQDFVAAMDNAGVGVMLDGTFNHSAWDAIIGDKGVAMGITTNPYDLIRSVRPAWFSKRDSYGQPASYYESSANNDIAPAPDRMDFGKWNDAADFFFGVYDYLVQNPPENTNWAWSSGWYNRYLNERDYFTGFTTNATRELWEYFTAYPAYWLEKTGHPEGTPKTESYKGIDGLRCDFAQGLPSDFWEYVINKTRSIKWDFIFMAESLDGYREVGGSKRHGVGFRSARHFDVLNENLVYYWRDNFFAEYSGGSSNKGTPNRTTSPTQTQLDNRKNAFDNIPLLLNLTSHDDIYSTYHQPSILHAYAELGALAGVPMIMYGQEAGAQNHYATYNRGSEIDPKNNFAYYESNFGKSIVNFKRYNCMTSVWSQGATWMASLRNTYGKIGRARQASPALKSQSEYFLSTLAGGKDENIFAIAKFESPGVSAGTQDVVIVFVNNNCQATNLRSNVYSLNADYGGKNWFGIQDGKYYNVVNLLGSNPTNLIWNPSKPGSEIKTNFYVSLNGDVWADNEWQIQYLKLIEIGATYPKDANGRYSGSTYSNWDWDGDGMANDWEIANGLDPYSAVGVNGAWGDKDGDRMANYDEMIANTVASNANDYLYLQIARNGSAMDILWSSKTNINYEVQRSPRLVPAAWSSIYFGTALGNSDEYTDAGVSSATGLFYRIKVRP